MKSYRWLYHAYGLMDNHFDLLIETPEAKLSPGMRQLNGVYTQYYNRRQQETGAHLPGEVQGDPG